MSACRNGGMSGVGAAAEYVSPELGRRLGVVLPYNHRLLTETMAATGLRVTDVLTLQPEDVAEALTHRGWLQVREQKTGKYRAVRLPTKLLRQLAAYSGQYWVFQSPQDPQRHLTRQAVNKMLKQRATAYRAGQQVSPHGYRKQYAVRLLEETGDLRRVQRAMGHDDPGTTALYALADKMPVKREERPL